MTEPTLDALLRRIIREEVAAALAGQTAPTSIEPFDEVLVGRPHRGITWQKLQETKIGRYTVKPGYPVRVTGERGIFTVVRIERHRETGKINVDVKASRTGHGRTFPLDQLKYVRPGSKRAGAA